MAIKLTAPLLAAALLAAACSSPDPVAEGIRELQQGNYQAAIANFTLALEQQDLSPEATAISHNGLADAHFELGNFAEAIEYYTRLLEGGGDRIIYNNRGQSLHNLMLYEEAVRDFDRALALSPPGTQSNAIILYNRAGSHDALGRLDEAKADLDAALELEPDFRQALELRSLVNASLGLEAESEADSQRLRELGTP